MKVLLLHPDDQLPSSPEAKWDVVFDLACAPQSTYADWSEQMGCAVYSIFEYANGIDDLYRIREFLQQLRGSVVDSDGIDWWEILSGAMISDLKQFLMLQRLAQRLGDSVDLYATRPDERVRSLGVLLNRAVHIISADRVVGRAAKFYWSRVTALDAHQLRQVLWDKFDPRHSIRHFLSGSLHYAATESVTLLPSAYINVSRTAVSYAQFLPEHKFLLACARASARLESLPRNVTQISLDPYFGKQNESEHDSLMRAFDHLEPVPFRGPEEFRTVHKLGIIERGRSLLSWGLAVRDAWKQLFECTNVNACLSADEVNPYSRIPLLLAKKRGLPALSCHHGALDCNMAWKSSSADSYLAKSEMEKDYLDRVCRVPSARIVLATLPAKRSQATASAGEHRDWLVFFAEPFEAFGWRNAEVYCELLPRLLRLAHDSGLRLVFKLHPFQSKNAMGRMLRRIAPEEASICKIISGPPSAELWERTKIAFACQSSVAMECSEQGIPIFLCAWLKDSYADYVNQFARFGVGHILESPEQISQVPLILAHGYSESSKYRGCSEIANPEVLRSLLSGNSHSAVALGA